MVAPKVYKPPALKLIDAAERLIGLHGYDRVSLQQIATEAGQANKFAVQYHFGSKKGIVEAVFEVRLPRIEGRRQIVLDRIREKGEPTIRDLLLALFQPVFEEVNSRGEHAFQLFAARIRHLPEERTSWFNAARLAQQVTAMLRERVPHLTDQDFDTRLSLTIDLLTGAARLLDDKRDGGGSAETAAADRDRLIGHALDMCAAALACPVSQDEA